MALQHPSKQAGGRRAPALRPPAAPPGGCAAIRLAEHHDTFNRQKSLWIATLLLAMLAGCRNTADPFRNVKYRTAPPRRSYSPPRVDEGPRLLDSPNAAPGLFTPPPYAPAPQASTFPLPTLEDEDRSPPGFEPIQLVAGYAPAGTGSIHGRVIDAAGRPQPGVSVLAVSTDRPGGERGETTTDANGNFGFHGLVDGRRYLLLASAIHSREPSIGRIAVTSPNQSVVIEIARPFAAGGEGNSHPGPVSKPTAMAASPMSKQLAQDQVRDTRQALARNSQAASPWDSPAPPAPTTQGARSNSPRGIGQNEDNTKWRAASAGRSPNINPAAQPPTMGAAQTRSQITATAPTAPANPSSSSLATRAPVAISAPAGLQAKPGDTSASAQTRPPLARPPQIASVPTLPRSASPGPAQTGMAKSSPPLTPTPPRSEANKALLDFEPSPGKSAPVTVSKAPPASGGQMPSCQFDGDRLVDFRLPDLQLRPVNFSALDGQYVLLDFWGTYCRPCLKSTPHLVDLQRRYGAQGLQVIGIAYEQGDVQDRVLRVQQQVRQQQINYPMLLGDVGGPCPVREKFQVHGLPTLVLLDKSGRQLWRSEGANRVELQRLENFLKN